MEDFVSFDLAKKLKEKGFNNECHAYYEPLKHCLNLSRTFQTNKLAENYNCVTAPTISQVLKWLREEKNYHITIDCYFMGDFGYIIYLISPYECEEANAKYNSYEEAALAGIEYVLDNLI